MMATREPNALVKVWDLPVRLTHWSFATLICAMWYTAENSLWYWHTRLGHVLLALLIFRVIWGFVGTRTAVFSSFVKGPRTIWAYVTGKSSNRMIIGHNPLGALAVLALLTVMFLQVGMGLFAGDPFDGATGPLNALVSVTTADTLTEWHEGFVYVVFGFAGLHILAIGFYAFARMDDMIGPMVTGKRELPLDAQGIGAVPWGRALAALAIASAIALWIWLGAPPLT